MADLYPAHLPFAPDFKTAAEAAAWAKENFGTDLKFSPDMDEKDKIANVAAISQELLRYKEAGVKIPNSINILTREANDESSKEGRPWWRSPPLGRAGIPKGKTDPAIWLNGAYPAEANASTLRHEIGHTLDWPKVFSRELKDSEFVADTYKDANDPRVKPPDATAMARYEGMGGPPIPRMLPPRRIPGYKEPSIIDHMVNLLKRKE